MKLTVFFLKKTSRVGMSSNRIHHLVRLSPAHAAEMAGILGKIYLREKGKHTERRDEILTEAEKKFGTRQVEHSDALKTNSLCTLKNGIPVLLDYAELKHLSNLHKA
ncbi:hypothetical protein HY994_05935 [Candidatus Micrarchaeota archaeon]|nr:hypothetical protein [Candidatus Micrarchaeota archaeon]